MKIQTILLTGGSGFIGRNFIEQQKRIFNILAPSHSKLDLLSSKDVDRFFRKNKIDVVIHCASIGGLRSNKDLDGVLRDNLKIFFNIVKNSSSFGKMINLGSGAEYDKSRSIKSVQEKEFGKIIPADDYGFYKYISSKYIEKSTNIYSLRLFGVFGKYEDYRVKFISNLICKYILKRPLAMVQNAYFDYVYIDDLVRIMLYFIHNTPQNKIYNIGSGNRVSLLSIAKAINTLDTYSLEISAKKKGINKEYTCSNMLLMKELKSFEFTPLEDSIKKLFDIYKNNQSLFDRKLILEDTYNKG